MIVSQSRIDAFVAGRVPPNDSTGGAAFIRDWLVSVLPSDVEVYLTSCRVTSPKRIYVTVSEATSHGKRRLVFEIGVPRFDPRRYRSCAETLEPFQTSDLKTAMRVAADRAGD